MQGSLRDEIRSLLYIKDKPMSREQIAALLPGREANSVNRMLRHMEQRGTVVEENGLFSLVPPQARV